MAVISWKASQRCAGLFLAAATLSFAGAAEASLPVPDVLAASEVLAPSLHFRANWTALIQPGGAGFGLLFQRNEANSDAYVQPVRWEEPNIKGGLGIGFDTRNPPTTDPFNADGNIHNRPEREVSIHWNGIEVANRLSPVEYREGRHRFEVSVDSVTGGAEITVRIDRVPVYNRFFVPFVVPFEARAVLGAEHGSQQVNASDFHAEASSPARPQPEPIHIRAFNQALNNKDHHTLSASTLFPASGNRVGRVLCTLTLAPTPQGVDPWDRMAAVSIFDDRGRKFEILRYMTPYRRGYSWTADVTDYLPLLQGQKKMEIWCETWGEGWLVTLDFHFFPGRLERVPYRVETLWSEIVPIGQKDHPVEQILKSRTVPAHSRAVASKLRFIVSGHGMSPNTNNAAEFLPLARTVFVNDQAHENLLWKTDNYLNPCRPQGGTWKYDRAGWGPGALVDPWDVDITNSLRVGKAINVRYTIASYVNETPVSDNPARHWITGQVIYYRSSGTRMESRRLFVPE